MLDLNMDSLPGQPETSSIAWEVMLSMTSRVLYHRTVVRMTANLLLLLIPKRLNSVLDYIFSAIELDNAVKFLANYP